MAKKPSRGEYDLPKWCSEMLLDDKAQQRHERRIRELRRREADRVNRRHSETSMVSAVFYVVAGILSPLLAGGMFGLIGVGVVACVAGAVLFAGLLAGVGPDSQRQITPPQMAMSIIAFALSAILIFGATSY